VPVTVDVSAATPAPSAFAQVEAVTPQTQQSGRARPAGDTTAPTVSVSAPASGATLARAVPLSATATDNVKVTGVQFLVDGTALGAEDTSAPYGVSWNTTTVGNGAHTLTARARDAAGNTKTSTVNVTVNNAAQIPVTITAITVDTYPSAVAISGNNAYVYGGDVIWTINTTTKTVTDKTALYNDPPAITPDGRKYVPNPNLYYQGNAPYDSVDVINTATGTVIKNIPIPICYDCAYANPSGPRDVVMSPNGQRVYVSEDYFVETGPHTTVVTMINTATDSVLGYVPVAPTSDMEIAPDGTIYSASAEYPVVTVYNADMSQIGTFSLTSLGYYYWSPTTGLALNGGGTRGYVVVQDFGVGQHVSVIDTHPASPTRNTEIAVITERTTALSPDGSRRYVAQPDGKTVVVYDTASNTVIGSFVTDQNAGPSPRLIAVAADGTLYITDMDDNKVYAVTVGGPTML
jgi:DNA-binding beta-propeller fold protein YncE